MTDRAPVNIKIDSSLVDMESQHAEQPPAGGLYVTVYEYRWTILILTVVVVLLAFAIYAYITRDGLNIRAPQESHRLVNPPQFAAQPAAPPAAPPSAPVATPDEKALLETRAALMKAKQQNDLDETEELNEPAENESGNTGGESLNLPTNAEPTNQTAEQEQITTPVPPVTAPKRCAKPKCRSYAKIGEFCDKHSGVK